MFQKIHCNQTISVAATYFVKILNLNNENKFVNKQNQELP